MGGLKGDVAIGSETEDHAERFPERDQEEKQEKHCGQSPKPRHPSVLYAALRSRAITQDPRENIHRRILMYLPMIFKWTAKYHTGPN
jgi:hypothetical protein